MGALPVSSSHSTLTQNSVIIINHLIVPEINSHIKKTDLVFIIIVPSFRKVSTLVVFSIFGKKVNNGIEDEGGEEADPRRDDMGSPATTEG